MACSEKIIWACKFFRIKQISVVEENMELIKVEIKDAAVPEWVDRLMEHYF